MERCTELTVPVSVRKGWQRLGKRDQKKTALHQTPQAPLHLSHLYLFTLWVLNCKLTCGPTSQKYQSRKKGQVNRWKTTKQNELSSAFPRWIWDLKKCAACFLLANRPLNNLRYTEHLTEMRRRWLTHPSLLLPVWLREGRNCESLMHEEVCAAY